MNQFLFRLIAAGLIGALAVSQAIADTVTLQEALKLSIDHSPQIKSAAASEGIASAEVGKAASAFNPRLRLQSSYTHLSDETVFGATPVWKKTTVTNTIGAEMVVYSGGQLEAGLQQARHGRSAASAMHQAVAQQVLAQVAISYYRAIQARDSIEIADSSIKALQSNFDSAQRLHAAGVVTKSDVLRAEVALTGAKERKIIALSQYSSALAALKAVIGLPAQTEISLSGDDSGVLATASQIQKDGRKELLAAEESVMASRSGVSAARAGANPTVGVHADFYNEPRGSEFPRTSDTLLAGIVVRFNIFDGGLTGANVKQAKAALDKANADLNSLKRQIEMEQKIADNNLESARARVATTASQVASAEESHRSLQAGYTEGITSLTDVLTAEAALTESRISRLNALQDEKIATIEWLKAYGNMERILQ